MQVLGGVFTLAAMAAIGYVHWRGVAMVERAVARRLLADARARDARAREFAAAMSELEGVR